MLTSERPNPGEWEVAYVVLTRGVRKDTPLYVAFLQPCQSCVFGTATSGPADLRCRSQKFARYSQPRGFLAMCS
jgi:hypothetical protein